MVILLLIKYQNDTAFIIDHPKEFTIVDSRNYLRHLLRHLFTERTWKGFREDKEGIE